MQKKHLAHKMPKDWFKKHKAVGGTLTFMTEKHPTQIAHRKHEKELEERKKSYRAWQESLGKK